MACELEESVKRGIFEAAWECVKSNDNNHHLEADTVIWKAR